MNRRALLGSLALATLGLPRTVAAQPARKPYRIGIFTAAAAVSEITGPEPSAAAAAALLKGLRELGYVYGEHFVTEPRSGEGKVERYAPEAAELVRRQPDVIVATGPVLPALHKATSTIPVVMGGAGDPIAQGFARTLGRPGGNFTGFSLQLVETTVKRLELLRELVPGTTPLALLRSDNDGLVSAKAAQDTAKARGWKLITLAVRDASEIEAAFKEAMRARAGGLLSLPIGLLDPHAQRIAELAVENRLPAVYGLRQYVDAGGLMSYAADLVELWRRAATTVDKILKGARPAELPVEQPTKFDLVVNLKAAKAIGLVIPRSFLARANEVLQ